MRNTGLSPTSLRRFPKYRAVAQSLADEGWDYITSADLARACDMQEILVRKDLAQTGVVGRRHRGYPIGDVIRRLDEAMGWTRPRRVAIVGAGHLARMLVAFPAFARCGISFAFAVDVDPLKVGGEIGGVPVISPEEAVGRQQTDPVRMAMLAVPTEVAQAATDRMVAAGVRAIMNFTSVTLSVPDGVAVADADILPVLAVLCHALKGTE